MARDMIHAGKISIKDKISKVQSKATPPSTSADSSSVAKNSGQAQGCNQKSSSHDGGQGNSRGGGRGGNSHGGRRGKTSDMIGEVVGLEAREGTLKDVEVKEHAEVISYC